MDNGTIINSFDIPRRCPECGKPWKWDCTVFNASAYCLGCGNELTVVHLTSRISKEDDE